MSRPAGFRGLSKGSGYDFNHPGPIASDGSHLWVGSGPSVTELSASNGSLIRVLRGPAYGFSVRSIAADAAHVWVLNASGSITELMASSGALVQIVKGSAFDLQGSTEIASDGAHVWVANPCGPRCTGGVRGSGSITELLATTGALVQVLSGATYELDAPSVISSDGTDLWVVNSSSSIVTEIDDSSGALVRSIPATGNAIDSDGTHVWLTVREGSDPTYPGPGVLELSAATGQVVAHLTMPVYDPDAVASDGTDVWIAECGCNFEYDDFGYNDYGNVAELSASTGEPESLGGVPSDALNGPTGIALAGGRAWVTNLYGDSVTSFPTS
jgi:DNA-binding beta-propeller fold protein YncE